MFKSLGDFQADLDRLVLVSNRGPIEYGMDEEGGLKARETGGGLTVALAQVARSVSVDWIAGPSTLGDWSLMRAEQVADLGNGSTLRFVRASEDAWRHHYEDFCNPTLWFVQHGLSQLLSQGRIASATSRGWSGYVEVNRAFADAVVRQLFQDGRSGAVMVHDYHLYLVPGMVREACPDASLQFFSHIPWPEPAAWSVLPPTIVREICLGLLGSDTVVFQTELDLDRFLDTCIVYLAPEIVVCHREGKVQYQEQTVYAWANPISVDVSDLQERVATVEAAEIRRALQPASDMQTIVRVDRLDPAKNLVAGFDAFAQLLDSHPNWRGCVQFLACLVPSREAIPEYRSYRDCVLNQVEAINARFGRRDWQPIRIIHEQDRLQALVALQVADVTLVNSLADGMNLVAKESAVLNQRQGVLVLSNTAGAFAELGSGALAVEPTNVLATADALARALDMPSAERACRAEAVRRAVTNHQLKDWLRLLLKDLSITNYTRSVKVH